MHNYTTMHTHTLAHTSTRLSCYAPHETDCLFFRVLLVREESRDLLEVLDSRVFQDPRVLLVRLASLESRY